MEQRPGTRSVLIGRMVGVYKVLEKIGAGGMGAVFLARDADLERDVAIKVLHSELAKAPDVARRFKAEAVALAKLNHPNITTMYALHREGDELFMVMELVRGETLHALIRRSAPLPPDRVASVGVQILSALDHAHHLGVIHRDLKPSNVVITNEGVIKVMDFGVARVLGTDRLTQHGQTVGTPAYMAPEQVRGADVDQRSDLYALGVALYELTTGHLPFRATGGYALMRAQVTEAPTPPEALGHRLPEWLQTAILRALAKDPADRFQTADEFSAALQAGLGSGSAPDLDTLDEAPTRVIVAQPAAGVLAQMREWVGRARGPRDSDLESTGSPGRRARSRIASAISHSWESRRAAASSWRSSSGCS